VLNFFIVYRFYIHRANTVATAATVTGLWRFNQTQCTDGLKNMNQRQKGTKNAEKTILAKHANQHNRSED
jgi:hypothetical protein